MRERLKKIWSKYNPLAISRRNKMKNQLVNTTPSLLCTNCMGGILFHDLGLKFQSPTINLMIFHNEFIRFILNMDDFLSGRLVFYKDMDFDCPCAHLISNTGLVDSITIHFTHYSTPKEAETKWWDRVKRINKDNLFVFLTERDGVTYEEIKSLESIKAKGLCVFTAHEYKDLKYTLYISKYKESGKVGDILERSVVDDSREYEKYFDFVKWFNESNGNYDISDYIKE